MKQIRNTLLLTAAGLWAVGMLTGCVKSDTELEPNSGDPHVIVPRAAVGGGTIETAAAAQSAAAQSGTAAYSQSAASPSSQTRAAVDGSTTALDLYFVRADETAAGTYGDYLARVFTATRPAGTGEQVLDLFNLTLYYQVNGLKTKLTGWHPGGGAAAGDATGKGYFDATTRTVGWTIDGQQDVMTAARQQGSVANPIPALVLQHRLTQLQFYPYAESQNAIAMWGKITKIEVLNQQNTAAYALTDDATGAVTFSGEAKSVFSAGIAAGGAALIVATAADKATTVPRMGNPVMIAPQSASSYVLTLRITTDKNKQKTVTLTQSMAAGTPYRLYLCFKEQEIAIETTVAQWDDAATSDQLGEVRIGDYLDGGIVYEVTDAKHYKVFSLDQNPSVMWSLRTYVLGPGGGHDETDGRQNVAAMKAYSAAHTGDTDPDTKTTGVLATDFPAAAYCDSYKGKSGADPAGSWYLPAKDELQAWWDAYQIAANKTLIDAALAANGGVAWPIYNGNPMIASSTEYDINADDMQLYCFDINGTRMSSEDKDYMFIVRCIKRVELPKPLAAPAVGDYAYSDGTYSTDRNYSQIPVGIVFWVDSTDPERYKVMALDEKTDMIWAAKVSYIIGAGARSDTDGKGNCAAIKSYFDANTGSTVAETTFAGAFPAAEYCYNYTGPTGTDPAGTWFLPAKSELQWLCCAYNGVAPESWDMTPPSSVVENPIAQNSWNARIKAVGGTGIIKYLYTSTESDGSGSVAWIVNVTDGDTDTSTNKEEESNVRCIRNIAPPVPDIVGDYYYSDGTHSTELAAGKTPVGVIFWVDPANSKNVRIHSLDEPPADYINSNEKGRLPWSTEVAATFANDVDDGVKNVQAVKVVNSDLTKYPAFKWCDEMSTGGSGWYLPATSELQYLWCAFNGVAPIKWEDGIIDPRAPVNTPAQGVWNGRLTDPAVGGEEILIDVDWIGYWSSCEWNSTGGAQGGWWFDVGVGRTSADFNDKSGPGLIRCIKRVTL